MWHPVRVDALLSHVFSLNLLAMELPNWALFREGDFVYFQQIFARENYLGFLLSPCMVERHMPDRMEGTFEEYSQVSEWVLPISDIQEFLLSINDEYF